MKTLIKSALLLLLAMSLTGCLDKPRAYESNHECIIREIQKCGSDECIKALKREVGRKREIEIIDIHRFGLPGSFIYADIRSWCNNPSNRDKN